MRAGRDAEALHVRQPGSSPHPLEMLAGDEGGIAQDHQNDQAQRNVRPFAAVKGIGEMEERPLFEGQVKEDRRDDDGSTE
jgi:hypothetical protein